ncbi:condensation domain-containing protein [Microbispora sp. KK1-11]|uniref:condensation domain-containing protein n=1 Tax=Microbispora sp. KK1-11 TaxID=2053005 RepID=UPI00115AAA40|nr:condensation domain-containing protein [Microbispora sp. KK1-11]TQS25869.1 hypothetical protein FLW16_28735 [Microbispora sp. KK1-11]
MTRDVSYAEKGLWFLHQTASAGACNVSVAVQIRSELDVPRLLAAHDLVVARHEALRTSYEVVDGALKAVAHEPGPAGGDVEEAPPGALLREAVETEHTRPFELAGGRLSRIKVWRRADDDHIVLLTAHHAAVDWTAMIVCAFEICALYGAGLDEAGLPPLTAPYAEFVAEQQAALAGFDGEEAWRYWSQALPAKRPEPPVAVSTSRSDRDGRHRVVTFSVGPEATRRIGKVSWAARVPPNVVVLALWVLALRQESGDSTIAVGLPRSLRGRRFDRTVGCFTNTVPLFVEVDADAPPGVVIEAVRERLADSVPHQHYPFELLAQRMPDLSTVPGRAPVYDATFNFVPRDALGIAPLVTGAADVTVELGGLRMKPFPTPPAIGPGADLSLHITELQDGMAGMVSYEAGLFESHVAERVRDRLLTLIAQL